VRFQVLMATSMKFKVFWDVALSSHIEDDLVRVHFRLPLHCSLTLTIKAQFIDASHSPCLFSNIPHLAKARCYGCNSTYQCGQVTATIHSKNIAWFHNFFSETTVWADHCYCILKTSLYFQYFSQKRSFREYYGLGPRILNDWCGRTTFCKTMHPI
jgi:hypothetical protein